MLAVTNLTQNYESWYFQNRDTFRLLRKSALDLLVNAIRQQQPKSVVNVQGRVKRLGSFKDKMSSNLYDKLQQVEDMVGLRIIVYLLSDYAASHETIKQNFKIIEDRLVTKKNGYKARHFIVSFDKDRLRLPEYKRFRNLRFEIQLCTILEHAWNEIEHDRGYKGDLPSKLHDEFLMLAKDLHTIDKKFQRITTKSIDYQKSLSNKKLEAIPITAPSLTWYLQNYYGDIPRLTAGFGRNLDKLIIRHLRSAGVRSLADLNSLIPSDFKGNYRKIRKPREGITFFRLLTQILVIYKFDLYFRKIWAKQGWFDTHDYLVFQKFGLSRDRFPRGVKFDCSGM